MKEVGLVGNAEREQLSRKMSGVLEKIRKRGSILVAMSGGVDSSLVALLAKMAVGDRAVAVTADSKTLPPGELEEAKRVAEEIGIRHVVVKVNELSNPDFVRNPPDRCYHCKKELILKLKEIAREHNLEAIVDGTNADDMKVHRPGAVALIENGVYSPLADVDLTKVEVRALAEMLGLPTADRPSMACLSSRFPYGREITEQGLRRVAEAERAIRGLVEVRELRVRDHGNLARIEVGRDERKLLFNTELLDLIAQKLKDLGFSYVTMDLQGYRSGSMDETLKEKTIPKPLKG
jgi:uncharacterized protein